MSLLSTLKRVTTNYNLRIPVFDSPGWGRDVENNFDTIDAVLFAITGFGNIRGVWAWSTAYTIGQRIIDDADGTLWQCQVDHTSYGEGTFAEYRTAEPTHWTQLNLLPSFRGAWVTATAYTSYEFLYDSARFGVTVKSFTSGASYNADVTAGNIITLVDLSAYVIPNPTVALNFIRANAATTAYELRTPAEVRNDIGADNATNLVTGTIPYARIPSTIAAYWSTSDSTTDWDTLTTEGWYLAAYRGDNPNGPTAVAQWYRVYVFGNGGAQKTQIAFPIYPASGNDPAIYMRSYSASTWQGWRAWQTDTYNAATYAALTGAQTIAGVKTFSSEPIFSAGIESNGRGTFGPAAVVSAATPLGSEHVYVVSEATTRITLDSYFTGANGVQLMVRSSRGTAASPSASAASDTLFYNAVYGHDGTGFQVGGSCTFAASETWTGSARGTQYSVVVVDAGTTTPIVGLLLKNGVASVFGNEVLHVAGDQNLTGGYTSTAHDAGTFSSGSYTPDPANGNLQRAINGGAHTLNAPTASGDYSIVIQYTNNASAGAMTISGFTKTGGDSLTTTNGHDFLLHIIKLNGFTRLSIEALQ